MLLLSMDATLDIKASRRHVGSGGVAAMKTAARRRARRENKTRLNIMGEDFTPRLKKLTGRDIS